MYVFPPNRIEFGDKEHQEASFHTLLLQTEITKSVFSLMSVATVRWNVNYTHMVFTNSPYM
jgi:hypothetical protein